MRALNHVSHKLSLSEKIDIHLYRYYMIDALSTRGLRTVHSIFDTWNSAVDMKMNAME